MGEPLSHAERKARGLPDDSLMVPVRSGKPHPDYLPGGPMDPAKTRSGFAHLREHQESLRMRGRRLLDRQEASRLYPEDQVDRYFRPATSTPPETLCDVLERVLVEVFERHGFDGKPRWAPTNNTGWNRPGPAEATPPPAVIEEDLP